MVLSVDETVKNPASEGAPGQQGRPGGGGMAGGKKMSQALGGGGMSALFKGAEAAAGERSCVRARAGASHPSPPLSPRIRQGRAPIPGQGRQVDTPPFFSRFLCPLHLLA